MYKVVILGLAALLTACASTNADVVAIASQYQPHQELALSESKKSLLLERCNHFEHLNSYMKGKCYMLEDVLVVEYRLRDKRRAWTPEALHLYHGYLVNSFCHSPMERGYLKDGLGVMVNLTGGRNGLPGKVVSYKDCQSS